MGTKAAMGLLTWDALGSLAVAIAIFLLLVDLMHRRTRWAARYPPGPMPMPGLGNLLQVDFHNLLSSVTQVRKVAGWGPHLAADSGWAAKPQAGLGAKPRRGRCERAFVPGLKNGWGFPKVREGKGLERGWDLAACLGSSCTALKRSCSPFCLYQEERS